MLLPHGVPLEFRSRREESESRACQRSERCISNSSPLSGGKVGQLLDKAAGKFGARLYAGVSAEVLLFPESLSFRLRLRSQNQP